MKTSTLGLQSKSGLHYLLNDPVLPLRFRPFPSPNSMNRSDLATIEEIIIEYEDHGCLTISIAFQYEEGSAQCGGGHMYGNTKGDLSPAFGKTIAVLCKIYGSLKSAVGQKVEVIKEGNGFNARAIGFRPLFTGKQHPDFIFKDFFPSL